MIHDEPAHFISAEPEEGKAARWRQFLECSDGRVVTGVGNSKEEAETCAAGKRMAREDYLRLPVMMRLKLLAEGDLLSTNMQEAVRLIIQHLRDEDHNRNPSA